MLMWPTQFAANSRASGLPSTRRQSRATSSSARASKFDTARLRWLARSMNNCMLATLANLVPSFCASSRVSGVVRPDSDKTYSAWQFSDMRDVAQTRTFGACCNKSMTATASSMRCSQLSRTINCDFVRRKRASCVAGSSLGSNLNDRLCAKADITGLGLAPAVECAATPARGTNHTPSGNSPRSTTR